MIIAMTSEKKSKNFVAAPTQMLMPKDVELKSGTLGVLIVKRVNAPQVAVEIGTSSITIGRDPESSDIVVNDTNVSRTHAKIEYKNGFLLVEDNNSRNGILFQNRQVKRLSLMDGDSFQIGSTTFVFQKK